MIIDDVKEKVNIDKKIFNEEKLRTINYQNKNLNEPKAREIKDTNEIANTNFKKNNLRQVIHEQSNIKNVSKNNKEFKLYLIVCIVYLIGIVLGVIYFKLISKEPEIKDTLIEKFLQIDNRDLVNKESLAKEIIYRNMKNIMLFWIVGASAIGSPFLVLLMLYKGFSISFTSSIILSAVGILEGNKFIFGSMFLYSALEVIAMIILLISALKVSVNVIINKKDVRYEIIRHSIVTLACVPIFVLSSIIEYVMC